MTELNLPRLRAFFLELGLFEKPVIVHASLKAFGHIQGGADVMLRALQESTAGIVVPTFTYKTMVTPALGPSHNGLSYGNDQNLNSMAEFFKLDMPADRMMGMFPETLRTHPNARRTAHPILSFAGINADTALSAQTLFDPLAPIRTLAEQDGWILLLGVDHTVNTSIHYGEKLAGRRQFTRWALTHARMVECAGFPGDSSGFNVIAPDIERDTRFLQIGTAMVQAMPLKRLLEVVQARLKRNPLDLLCEREDCERCNAIRDSI
jgi:aminoglycoside 3-N-acetyltransferase